jgi:two-component sensor histidine kinase
VAAFDRIGWPLSVGIGGRIASDSARLALPADDVIVLGVRDERVGLSPGFELGTARSLGMRIVQALVQQLNAKFTFQRLDPGTEFVLSVPR